MLTEILFASVKPKDHIEGRAPGLGCSSLYPCAYRMYLVQSGKNLYGEFDPRSELNMSDGWDLEEQSVKRLAGAGIEIFGRDNTEVRVGRSLIPGHFDGLIRFNGEKMVWEHKAWATYRFSVLKEKGIDAFPQEKCQVNAYMLGTGCKRAIFFVKCKETNDYYDLVVPLDESFINPVIEWADNIRLLGWVPEPKLSSYCVSCGVNCFGESIDFEKVKMASEPEMVEKWKRAKQLQAVGGMMEEEARLFFTGEVKKSGKWERVDNGLIGDKEILQLDGLKIQLISKSNTRLNKSRVLDLLGPEDFYSACDHGESTYFTYRETT